MLKCNSTLYSLLQKNTDVLNVDILVAIVKYQNTHYAV